MMSKKMKVVLINQPQNEPEMSDVEKLERLRSMLIECHILSVDLKGKFGGYRESFLEAMTNDIESAMSNCPH